MSRTLEEITLEAEAVALFGQDAIDEWVTDLDDDEFVLYQRWQNRAIAPRFTWIIYAPIDRESLEAEAAMVAEMQLETMQKAIEFLEELAEYLPPPRTVEKLGPQSRRLVPVALPNQSHVSYCRMKPIRFYAPRFC